MLRIRRRDWVICCSVLLVIGFVFGGLFPHPWSWSHAFLYALIGPVVFAVYMGRTNRLDKWARARETRPY